MRDRIERAWVHLSPAERQVAQFVLERAGDLAGYTGAELAASSGASKATVSRFFRRLGFDSFAQARADARSLRDRGVPVGELAEDGDGPVAAHVAHDRRNLARTADNLSRVDLDAVADLLARSRTVLVVGWRNSHPVALHLREQLVQARAGVVLAPVPGQTVAEEVAGLDEDDVLVLVAFRRRPPVVEALLELSAERGLPVVLLTDPSGPFPAGAHRVEVPISGAGAFDGYAAAMTVVTVLAEAVLARRGTAGRDRVRAVAAAHEALDELEER